MYWRLSLGIQTFQNDVFYADTKKYVQPFTITKNGSVWGADKDNIPN